MRFILLDSVENVENLLPLTFTRPISAIRVGILTLAEKWGKLLESSPSVKTVDFLKDVFPCEDADEKQNVFIFSNILPEPEIVKDIKSLSQGEKLTDSEGTVLAFCGSLAEFEQDDLKEKKLNITARRLNYVFDIFLQNHTELINDYKLLTKGRTSQPLSPTNLIIGDFEDADGMPMVFMEEGARVEGATLNLREGPIYIGRNAEVMEGCCLRGPVALCESARFKMGAKVYGATTLGPYCKAGGELSNVVMFGYSNKAHDGYLGNAVIGEWCNIGAGVNASNLKNDYTKIRIWNYPQRRFMRTDLQFCGLIMGDHSKAGVNCMFNTATVLGVGVNVHGCGFPRVFVPSFSEGSASGGFTDVSLKKFLDIAERVMGRRGKTINEHERKVFEHVYGQSQKYKSTKLR